MALQLKLIFLPWFCYIRFTKPLQLKRLFTLFVLFFITLIAKGQTKPFGVVDTADLKMTTCDFEKGANALVLFDEAQAHYRFSSVKIERHKRIKILNDKGMDAAKVRIEYYGAHNDETISDIKAQTINLNRNNVIEYTPVDKPLIYIQNVDKETNAVVFTFPNVKPGSIVEFTYKWSTPYPGNFPDWLFQSDLPTRYSELQVEFSKDYTFKFIKKVSQKFSRDSSIFMNGKNDNGGIKYIWALKNVHSLAEEPYMSSLTDNIQAIMFQVSARYERTWNEITNNMLKDEDFGSQLSADIYLNDQDAILAKINALKTEDKKIAYIFDLVKKSVTWNNFDNVYTDDGIKKAWNKKSGNAAEINIILYHFLKKAGLNVYPVCVNTHGKIIEDYATTHQLNKIINYVIVGNSNPYILDATNKYNVYNEVPFYLLNSNGLLIHPEGGYPLFIKIENNSPKRNVVFINAEITAGGKIKGTAQIANLSYNKINSIKKYKDLGEKGYKDDLKDNDNNLKIDSMKLINMETDSLPLIQNLKFSLDLNGSDENYIYFNPNLFTGLNTNPFLSEERYSDIDFKYLKNYIINGLYKIPVGYVIEALPKSQALIMPDKSIMMKRATGIDDGSIVINYVITFTRSYYTKDEYVAIREFYKKMYEMLNEQIVLKKS